MYGKTCYEDGCSNDAVALGLCQKHIKAMQFMCEFTNCKQPATRVAKNGTRWLCEAHAFPELMEPITETTPVPPRLEKIKVDVRASDGKGFDLMPVVLKANELGMKGYLVREVRWDEGVPRDEAPLVISYLKTEIIGLGAAERRIKELETKHVQLEAQYRERDNRYLRLEADMQLLRGSLVQAKEEQQKAQEVIAGLEAELESARRLLADGRMEVASLPILE